MTPPTSSTHQRPATAIDPRLRARRIEVQRDVGRRRLRRLAVLGGFAVVLGGAVALALSPLLDVDAIEVRGASEVTEADVEAAAGVARGDQLVLLDASSAAAEVERLPWVADATVTRSWPGTVELRVQEREPLAGFARADGRVALADAGGRVLDVVPAEETDPGVVTITGSPAPGPPGSAVGSGAAPPLRVVRALPPDLAPRVAEVAVGADGSLTLLLRASDDERPAQVLLGDDSQLPLKVEALATVLARVDLADVRTIDLEVPSAPALTRR